MSGFPEKGVDLPGVRETSGEVRETSVLMGVLFATPTLRTRRPPTGVFGPEGPEVPLGVSERVSPKIGVCPKVSGEVPLGPVQKVT